MTARIARWVLVVLSVAFYEGMLAEYFRPGGSGLRWDLLVILLAGLTGGVIPGILAGGIVGLLTDCLTPSFLGWGMMVKLTLGGVIGMARERLFLEQSYALLVVCAAGVAAHDLVYLFPATGFDPGLYLRTLWPDSAVSALVTGVIGAGVLRIRRTCIRPAKWHPSKKVKTASSA